MKLLGCFLLTLVIVTTGCTKILDTTFNSTNETRPVTIQSGHKITEGLYQLTGRHLIPGQKIHHLQELADPAPPFITEKGEVEIYGSAPYFIRYANWKTFSEAGPFEIVPLLLTFPTGALIEGTYNHPWDLRKYRVIKKGIPQGEFIVGGAMSATQGRPVAVWPDDNPNRRIFRFHASDEQAWVREENPIIGDISMSWLGHSYGGNFLQLGAKDPNTLDLTDSSSFYFFYERVNVDRRNSPYQTEIYVQKMTTPMASVSDPGQVVVGVGSPPYPSTERSIGGYLVEGPRPAIIKVEGKQYFIIGFSSGDFCTDGYSINYAWSQNVMGPYKIALTADKRDLLDLGLDLKRKYGLSWMGRPSIYQTPTNQYEMLFHAVDKQILPQNDYTKWPKGNPYELWQFFRSIFKVGLTASIDSAGDLKLEVL